MIDLTRFTPSRILPAVERRLKEVPFTQAWYNSNQGKRNRDYLQQIHNRYAGERLFLIANGPSIKDMDLSVLKDKYTMCMNRFYIYFDKLGFTPTFLTCVEELVLEQFKEDFNNLSCETFFNWRFYKQFPKAHFLKEAYSFNPFFQDNILEPTHFGGTVTYACLQLAYYMGFKEVVIIGMDHSFKEKGLATKVEVRNYEKDESHFDPNYFPKGIKWKLPDLDKSEYSYALARDFYQQNGREIIDATVGGKCTIFKKGKFSNYL
ncbi:6-hydroxymethylpterin diphosphokinase MptE-like protein [Spirosoma oryzicola]|uniref:6-hydroxymethylpterin diphosphokinase MptE-like protein n=1 Tax=Spirosoma oryzicola TaxID=2898794 RepID=UPI001E5EB232|nr:6-hydroxymethylpterin diphosphokinase MptE-like protein [Spirosoma oryzicola]UHG92237.1 DUF115 domain-containing protein [Spirosoma oryzicola]